MIFCRALMAFAVAVLCLNVVPAHAAEGPFAFQRLATFSASDEGTQPTSLIAGADGCIYGTTSGSISGPLATNGTVFKLALGGEVSILVSIPTNGTNGLKPVALVHSRDGNFYGATYYGGSTPFYGAIFKLAPGGVLSTLFAFAGANGRQPIALVQGADGNLYGATRDGGDFGYGTVFKLTTNGVMTPLMSFAVTNGVRPNHLIQGADGNLYGTTFDDIGVNAVDNVFKLSLSGEFTILASSQYSNTPAGPSAIVQGPDGSLYVASGGRGGFGNIFRVSTNGGASLLVEFNGTNGWFPDSLLVGSDGNLYGTTEAGGADYTAPGPPDYAITGSGTIFKVTLDGALTTLRSFAGTDGNDPILLAQTSDGILYCATESEQPPTLAAIFRLAPRPVIRGLDHSPSRDVLSWTSFSGGNYQVECNTTLSTGAWSTVLPIINARGNSASATNQLPSVSQGYYRVHLLP
jgi:uncharacterized repeat protein (TIGR03803 family)